MILWDGSCMVHEIFSVGDLLKMKKQHPAAKAIAHPECPQNILEHADFVGGTEAMIKYVGGLPGADEFIVATEPNMMWQLERRFPQHTYLPVPGITCACNKCPHMAREHAGEGPRLPEGPARRRSPGSRSSTGRKRCWRGAC